MSIIRNYRIAQRWQSLWAIPSIIWLLTVFVWLLAGGAKSESATPIWLAVIGFFVVFFDIALIQWRNSQADVIRFHNIRAALISGHIAIVAINHDDLRKIADEVSGQLSKLGVTHLGSGNYTKHLPFQTDDIFYQITGEDISETVPEQCKLILAISAVSYGSRGVEYLRYCLLDRSGINVMFLDEHHRWPDVPCGSRIAEEVAVEIIGGLFDKINLTIRATTPPGTKQYSLC